MVFFVALGCFLGLSALVCVAWVAISAGNFTDDECFKLENRILELEKKLGDEAFANLESRLSKMYARFDDLESVIAENNSQARAASGRLESQAAIVAAHQKRLDEHESRFKAEHEWAEAELAKLTPCPHDAAVQKTNAEIDRSRVARLEAAVNSLDRRLLDVSVWMRNKIPSVPKPKKKAVKKKPAKKKRAKR